MKDSITEIKAIIKEIEKVDALITKFNKGNDSTLRILAQEFLRKKRSLIKELITVLVLSSIDIRFFKNLYKKAFDFLEKSESRTSKSTELELIELFQKAENLMALPR